MKTETIEGILMLKFSLIDGSATVKMKSEDSFSCTCAIVHILEDTIMALRSNHITLRDEEKDRKKAKSNHLEN